MQRTCPVKELRYGAMFARRARSATPDRPANERMTVRKSFRQACSLRGRGARHHEGSAPMGSDPRRAADRGVRITQPPGGGHEHAIDQSGDGRDPGDVRGGVAGAGRQGAGEGARDLRRVARHALRPPRGAHAGRGARAPRAESGSRARHDARDGQADRPGARPRSRSAPGLRLLRRARRAVPRPRSPRDGRVAELRALRPARRRPRRDALELPLLAGLPLRRARADGRQRRRC